MFNLPDDLDDHLCLRECEERLQDGSSDTLVPTRWCDDDRDRGGAVTVALKVQEGYGILALGEEKCEPIRRSRKFEKPARPLTST